jgi:hypothetical protein
MTNPITQNQFADYHKEMTSRFTPGFIYYFDWDVFLHDQKVKAKVCYQISKVDYHNVCMNLVLPCSDDVWENCDHQIVFSSEVYSIEKLVANGLNSVSCLYPFKVGQVLQSSKPIHLYSLTSDANGKSYVGQFDTNEYLIKIDGYTLRPYYMTIVSVQGRDQEVFQARLINQNYSYGDLIQQ